MSMPSLHIELKRGIKVSLARQVYEKIRDDILLAVLLPGTRLPATRGLAAELGVSRNVILDAYDQLHAEGYIESRAGSYTRVCDDTHYTRYKLQPDKGIKPDTPVRKADISFQTGVPDLSCFPRVRWGTCLKRAVAEAALDDLAYYRPEGHEGFRQVLADYLYRARGIQVPADNIVVTSGATQALFLAARVLHVPGCEAVIEDPCGYGVMEILRTAGYGFNPVANTLGGPDVSRIKLNRRTRMVYVTPSHQFPMGHIMPAAVRIALLNRLCNRDIYIVEDDYDSEFRYDGSPIHPLKALDLQKVIYIGSFSKVLSPALRIGYAVVPDALLPAFKRLKRFSDAQSPVIEQVALQQFIRDGGYERHIFRMKKIYRKKRDALVEAISTTFGNDVVIQGENAGLHLVACFRDMSFDMDEKGHVWRNRVRVPSVEKHAVARGRHRDKLVFGYGDLSEAQIRQGIRQFKGAV